MSESAPTWVVLAIIGGTGLLLILLTLVVFTAMTWLFARLGRWGRLAERYPARGAPPARLLHGQTIKVGPVRYRRCVTVGLDPEGLTLQVRLPSHAPAWIPWGELHSRWETRLYWLKAVGMLAGGSDPLSLVFPARLFAQIEPYLRN